MSFPFPRTYIHYVPEICTRGTWAGRRGCRRRAAASWPAEARRFECDSGTRPEKGKGEEGKCIYDFLREGRRGRGGGAVGRLRPGANFN